MTEDEIWNAMEKAKTTEDYRKLYVKVFGEEPQQNSSNWYKLESDIIIDALSSGKNTKGKKKEYPILIW